MRNIRKTHSLRSEVMQIKRKVSDYEKVICQLQQEIKTVKNCKDKSVKHLQKQCELSSLDFKLNLRRMYVKYMMTSTQLSLHLPFKLRMENDILQLYEHFIIYF